MDQCTFGAGPLRGARGETASQRPAKKSEHARIFLFSFAPLTLNVKHGREIVPDRTPAEQPRGPRPHGLRHGAKPLKREQVMSAKDEGESDNVGGLPTEFRFDESPVRAVMYDGEPWFIAKDVCDILDIADPSMALSRLDEDEKDTTSVGTTSGPREMLTVNESGVYSLVFTSRKPEAKRFRKWVTSEVLPEIRKTGGYRRPETQFAGLSGEWVEYERWLLERALLDAKLIALGMQSIGVHYERMVTDDPDFGAARADTNFADYHRELRANVHRSIEFIRRAQPGSVFNRGPKPVESSSQQDLGSGA
jgi:hypothetical protein